MFFIANCFDPIPPINGSIDPYNVTTEGATISFQCDDGYVPTALIASICNRSLSEWTPPPQLHNCSLLQGNLACHVQAIAANLLSCYIYLSS